MHTFRCLAQLDARLLDIAGETQFTEQSIDLGECLIEPLAHLAIVEAQNQPKIFDLLIEFDILAILRQAEQEVSDAAREQRTVLMPFERRIYTVAK